MESTPASGPGFATVLHAAPVWAWLILGVLVAIGFAQARERRLSVRMAMAIPLAMTALSVAGIALTWRSTPQMIPALATWLVGVFLVIGLLRRLRLETRYPMLSNGVPTIVVAGSWVPLVLLLAAFVTRFALTAASNANPNLPLQWSVIAGVCGVYAVVSGAFLARGLAIVRAINTDHAPGAF